MNWTGGTLSRTRNANAKVSLIIKQKNYFAKARGKLQDGQRPPPPDVQYFDFGEWKSESRIYDDRRSDPAKSRAPSQRTLDQFENVQGVVRQLKSLRPRNEGKKRKRSVVNDTEGYVLPSGIPVPPISPTVINSDRPPSSYPVQPEPTAKRVEKRLRASTPSTTNELYPLATLDSVEAKRRRLLQESDWVGIERQKRLSKPVKMKFMDAEDRDLIGRRRPLDGSAIQNRWNVRGSRPMKIPPITSFGEADKSRSQDRISIRIGSTATNKEPSVDEMLDHYQSSEPKHRFSPSFHTSGYEITGHGSKPQHRTHKFTTPSPLRKKSPEPFHSLFSSGEVDQSGIAQLMKAATTGEDEIRLPEYHQPQHRTHKFTTPSSLRRRSPEPFRSLFSSGEVEQSGVAQLIEAATIAKDEPQSPENYRFPDPEPGFRLVFKETPQPRGQTSDMSNSSDPVVRDFAYPVPRAAAEQRARPEDRKNFGERMSEQVPFENGKATTSPLGVATSRYMQELENLSSGSGGPRVFAKDKAGVAASARVQPSVRSDQAIEKRGTIDNQEPKVSVHPEEFQDKENIKPTENDDEIWRNFVNLDNAHDFQSSQKEPISTQNPHAKADPLPHQAQLPDQASPKPIAQKASEPPPPDDEALWQNFIFSSPNPSDEWIIEEASPYSPRPDSSTPPSNPASTQTSMIAEAGTSPLKRHPHLTDETLDDPSPYAHASKQSPKSTDLLSKNFQQTLSPTAHSSIPSSPCTPTHDNQTPPPPNTPHRPKTTISSSLIAHASSSLAPSDPLPTHSLSSGELAWTPSRLPVPPQIKEKGKGKVVFRRPTRYVGERAGEAVEAVHIGRRVGRGKEKEIGMGNGKGREKERKTRSPAQEVERAKSSMNREGKGRSRGNWYEDGYEDRDSEEMEEMDEDDIVDD